MTAEAVTEKKQKPVRPADQTDYDRMVALATFFREQQAEKAHYEQQMKSAKDEILKLASANYPTLFAAGRLELGAAYVKESNTSKVVLTKDFDGLAFFKKYPNLVKKLDLDAEKLKAYMGDGDIWPKIHSMGVDMAPQFGLELVPRKDKE